MTTVSDVHAAITSEVLDEVASSITKHGDQNHLPDGTGWPYLRDRAEIARRECQLATRDGCVTWRHILREEYREAIAETDPVALRAELLQVAAVAVKWIEAIDTRQEATSAREEVATDA